MSHESDPRFAQPQGYGSMGFSVAPRSVTYPEIVPALPDAPAPDPQFTEETMPAIAAWRSFHAAAATDSVPGAEPGPAPAPASEADPAPQSQPQSQPQPQPQPQPRAESTVATPTTGTTVNATATATATVADAKAEVQTPPLTAAAPLSSTAVITEVPVFIERTPQELFNEPSAEFAAIGTRQKPLTATQGLRGMLGTVGIRLAPGRAEQAQLDSDAALQRDEQTIRQATWTRAVSILVANRKGGVGKTPVSLLLGGTLAAVRGGSVCIVEVSDDPGALTFRAEGTPRLGLGELVQNVATIASAGQLAGYTAPQTSFASVIGTVGNRAPLTRANVVEVAAVIDEFYSLRVMDSGNQSSSDAFDGAVETADALVIPVLNAGDAVFEALALLERLRAAGGKAALLADNAVILRLSDGRPEHPEVMERVDRIIDSARVAQVLTVPYDAHIAERGQLTLGSLDPETYRVFASAAAALVRGLQVNSR